MFLSIQIPLLGSESLIMKPLSIIGVGGHSWELGPVPFPHTEVNLPGDSSGSVVREPTRNLDRCQLHFLRILFLYMIIRSSCELTG